MSLKDALGLVTDLSKFVQTLWAAYIGLIVAIIGWLLTLKTKPSAIDGSLRNTLIITFIGVSCIFAGVLYQNHDRLIRLMRLVDEIAPLEAKKVEHPEEIYRQTFQSGSTPVFLHATVWALIPIVICVSLFICQLTE